MTHKSDAGLELVIASSNEGKIREIKNILMPSGIRLFTKWEVESWPSSEQLAEHGMTYLDNSLSKARAVRFSTGMGALADDSGIEIDALDGAPGVRSARFAGEAATDEDNNQLMASLLKDLPAAKRGARYVCVAVAVLADGSEILEWGMCAGSIATEPRGAGGFGYDPWFIPVGGSRTMAELPEDEKNAISHRGIAFRKLAAKLKGLVL